MNRYSALARVIAGVCAISAMGCTGGYITRQNGNQWLPSAPAGSSVTTGVVTISNNTNSYQVWAGVNAGTTIFSFDPGAAIQKTGNFVINNNIQIPNGTYTFTVSDTHVWQASNVTINNTVPCPSTDYWNGGTTSCQLFHIELLDCGVKPIPPYQSGNETIVQLAQINSGQCGPVSCPNNVQDVQGSFLVNPVIEEIYWGCPPGAPKGCATSTNTGIWPSLAASTQFWSRMVEYGVGNGTYGGLFSDTPAGVGSLVSDSDAQNAILAELASGKVTTPYPKLDLGHGVIFVIYLPVKSCTSFNHSTCNSEGAHHSSFRTADGQEIYYALINGSTDPAFLDGASSHEVAEAATDADPYNPGCGTNKGCGWNEPGVNQGEIGDLCGGFDSMSGHGSVAQVWSQARCPCL